MGFVTNEDVERAGGKGLKAGVPFSSKGLYTANDKITPLISATRTHFHTDHSVWIPVGDFLCGLVSKFFPVYEDEDALTAAEEVSESGEYDGLSHARWERK